MDKIKLKQVLIDFEVLIIDEETVSYEDFLNGNNLNHNDVIDSDDQSHHNESMEIAGSLDAQIHEHKAHLQIINRLSFEPTDTVKPGAVILVNNRCMIVAVSKPKFTIDGVDYIGISIDAPIYTVLKGKKAGEKFVFNGQEFKIDAVN